MIKINHVTKIYNDCHPVVNNISLTIKDGETLALLGSSGSGKTTLLKMINQLITPTHGTIEVDHKNITQYQPVQLRRSIGYVFQQIGLFPHMTVEKNIAIVLKLMRHSKAARKKRVFELLEMVHLDPHQYRYRYPDELSGGQKQRVGVARALAADPKYLLMDEPFAAIDAIARDSLQEEMIHLKEKLKKTIVFVTHDLLEAFRIADRIAILHHGNLEQLGTQAELIENPRSDFVRRLIETPTKQREDWGNSGDQQ